VGSFHAAGPDARRIFETKYLWDQLISVFSVIEDPTESRALYRNCLEQQRLHWPALDRALRFRALAKSRTPFPVSEPTPDWAKRAVSRWGEWVFRLLERAHAAYAWGRGHGSGAATEKEYEFWVQLQRKALFAPEKLLS
jgi:hypothetical protein